MTDAEDKHINIEDIELKLINIMDCIVKEHKEQAYASVSKLLYDLIKSERDIREQKMESFYKSLSTHTRDK